MSVCLVFQVGHCAIGKWRPLAMRPVNASPLILRWHLGSFQRSPLLTGCRNCEDVCDCHRGSSVLADFHGLVHHQQHQTGDCHHLFIYLLKKRLPPYFLCRHSWNLNSILEANMLFNITSHSCEQKSFCSCTFAVTLTCRAVATAAAGVR